jgi:hypothetical protein
MKRLRVLSLPTMVLALVLAAMPALAQPPLEGVSITSRVQANVGGAVTNITFTGSGAHTRNGLNVNFTVKQLSAASSPLGPISASLDSARPSTGTLSSSTFPAVHRQNFFLKIKTSTVGTLISDVPLTLSATIRSSPPTATYTSTSGNVAFYREGDPNKQPVLTVQSVSSDITPAASQTVNISSLVTATVGTATTTVQFTGSATDLVSGQNVLFISKQLTAANSALLGPTTATLDSRQSSDGTLASAKFPTTHTQNFFLQIQSQNLGTLVADAPIVLAATIQGCPPNATYRFNTKPVPFYRQGDPNKETVLTIQDVVSDVTPSTAGKALARKK